MEEDTEYIKLPVEDRCVHKLWKARLHGYEEAAKLFRQIDDEKSPEFNKFLGLVKKFVIDSNAVAQEKGLEAVLAFIENSSSAAKTVGEVMSGVITKCIAAPKTKTKELAVQVTLMYIEIEKFEAVQEEILKGMEHKNPKIVSACISVITQGLREFGLKVINIKPLIKKMPVLLEDRDKGVREEGKMMVIEIYRWIGDALKPQLNSLKPVQVTELEAEFVKVKGEKVVPTRYLKSQQQKQAKMAAEAAASGDGEDEVEDEEDGAPDVDPYELMEPVDILSKLPKDFYEKLEAKKWQERKEAVDNLEQLLQIPKLESGDYGDVVRALKKIISKDSNVMVVAVAGKCLAGLANGLKKKFQPYAGACIPCILEKFREKKQNVVIALREAIDAIFLSTTLEAIQEDVLAALENKNPQVKAETASFLARCFTKCTPMMLNKKLLKAYTTALLKTLNEPDPTVRDTSAEALGTAMKAVGEKQIMVFMTDLDNMKMTKIKDCCDKAVIVAKVPKSERPNTAPAKLARGDADGSGKVLAGSAAPKPVKRPATAGGPAPPKKTQQKKQPSSATAGKGKTPARAVEKDLSQEEVDEKAAAIFSEEIISGLSDANWKTRLSAVEQLTQSVVEMETEIPTQVLIRTLNKKPGLKDTNFQVLKARLEAVKLLAENARFTSTVLDYCITDIADKLGDVKNGTLAAETLTCLAEATKLELVATEVMNFAFIQKSPKVQQEALVWLCSAIREFGFQSVQPKPIMDNVKKAVSATNPAVRNAAMNLIGTLYMYLGSQLSIFFEDEKPQVQQQIQAEFDKHTGECPPVPIRGLSKKGDKEGEDDDDEGEGEEDEQPANEKLNIHDLMPHVDISAHITEVLLSELTDRNWKVRNEALQKLSNILNENKLITSNLGELPPVLAQRLVDSNIKIAAAAISICQSLGTAMGAQCKPHVRTLFPGILQGMGDSKPWIRTAATACANTWGEHCGFKEFFEGEMIGDALKSGSPTLRIELWAWLTERLPTIPPKSIPKDELLICLPNLYTNVEDRNADVRKNAQEAILPFMIHLGYVAMAKATEKLKTGSRSVVIAALDKTRPNLPEKPLTQKKTGSGVSVAADDDMEPNKVVRSGGAKVAAGKNAPKGKVIGGSSKPSGRKKDDDVDTSPLLQNNNLKNQRSIDEQKLKVLKWNFTTPREEFVDLLKDQMMVANVNKSLMANMFHSDFKFHLKAIEALNENLPNNGSATVANLDLILKWMTLRFFDTNPSVLLKGLEYLQTVFAMLIEEEYNMFENEASSFIPYLILKIGDPKDAVRNGVRGLFKQIEQVYPSTKIFAYVMEGLKSKNARQRTECLEQLGSLIENYGVTVCQPNPSAALKEIARQISDRDNSVRNAALNCVVQAYFIEQDRVYKMIGQISDKDLSLLEERIKRAAKNRVTRAPAVTKQQQQQQLPPPQKMVRQGSEGTIKKEPVEQEESPPPPPPTMRSTVPKPRPISTGPFGLDFDLLQRIEGKGVSLNAPKLAEFDLHDIIDDTPVSIPNSGTVSYGLMGLDPLHLYCNPLGPFYSSYPTLSPPPALQPFQVKMLNNMDEKTDRLLDSCIPNIACPDIKLAIQTTIQLDTLLQTDKALKLKGKVDQVILGCVMQLRLLTSNHCVGTPKGDVTRAYRSLFMLLMSFYSNIALSRRVSKDVLRDLIEQLISLLVNRHMEELESGESYVRIINTLVVRIIERSDHTNITCALIKLLYESAGSSTSPPRFMELVMKCLWKVVKMFPSWEAETDFDMVLYDIHLFLKDFPSASWKKRSSDTPVRTIKTILHCMTKIKGNRILLHLSRICNPNESELESYLMKLIKTVKQESSPPKKESKSQHRLSKTTHELLSEIFKKIGSKDQTKEGLSLLYDFKQQHPEADIDPFLRKSSQFFQDYIERGLQTIDMDRRRAGEHGVHPVSAPAPLTAASSMSSLGIMDSSPVTPQNDVVGEPNLQNPHTACMDQLRTVKARVGIDSGGEDSDSSSGSKNALYYLERLRALQEQAGHDPSALLFDSKQQVPRDRDDNAANDENLNKKSVLDDRPEELLPVHRSSSNSGLSGVDVLRKRLEVLKGSAR